MPKAHEEDIKDTRRPLYSPMRTEKIGLKKLLEGTVTGWMPSLGLLGGPHSARPRLVSRKVMVIGWLGIP